MVVMGVVFCIVAALTAPSLRELAVGALVPSVPPGSLLIVLALIGTTVVSYNLFLHASTALEQWPDAARKDVSVKEARLDTLCSVMLGGLVTASVLVTAIPLHGLGVEVSAATVGQRLEPLLGPVAPVLFAAGLFAAGLTSSITAPLAAAYAVSGAFGWTPDLRSTRLRLLGGFVAGHRRAVRCAVRRFALPGDHSGAGGQRPLPAGGAGAAADHCEPDRDHGPLPQLPPDQHDRRAGGAGHRRALGSANSPACPESWSRGQRRGVRCVASSSASFTRGSDCRNRSGGNRL